MAADLDFCRDCYGPCCLATWAVAEVDMVAAVLADSGVVEVASAVGALVVLAVGALAAAVRGEVGSGAPGVPARPPYYWTGETPVAPLATL